MRFRYRPFQAAVIALLAALITACAAFAPLYDRAMRQALADVVVERTPPALTGLQVSAAQTSEGSFGVHGQNPPPDPTVVVSKIPADLRRNFLDPITGFSAVVMMNPGQPADPGSLLVWREGECEHLELVDGTCPSKAGDIVVSEADVENFGLRTGSTFTIAGVPGNAVGGGGGHARPTNLRVHVTGVYRQVPSDYWFGLVLTGRSGTADLLPPNHVQADIWLTSQETFASGDSPTLPQEASTVAFPLDRDAVGVDQLLSMGTAVDGLLQQPTPVSGATFTYLTGINDLADEVRDQTGQSRVTVPLLMAQLGLLAGVVLWLVLLAVTEQRRPEVALARLRGRGRGGARRLLLGELLPVTLAGVVPGVLLAVAGTWFARTVMLPGDAPFELRVPLLYAVVIAVAALVLVTVAAVVRVAREPVVTLLRRVPPRRTTWALGVADALLIAGCGSVVVVFATGGLEGPIALAAPGLLAIVVGLVLAHLTTPSAALLGGRLLRRGRVRSGVSVLDAARSPATRRVVATVTLATALAVFSADALLVGDRNRASASEQEAGAPVVAEVRGTDLAAVRAALAEVDPGGRRATPVVRALPPSDAARATLAVLPDGFAQVALFPGGAPPASYWDRLAAPDTEPIRVTGTSVDAVVSNSTLRAQGVSGDRLPVDVGLDVVTGTGEVLHVALAQVTDPVARARWTADLGCREGCLLTGITFGSLPGATIDGGITFDPLETEDGSVPLGPAGQWGGVDDPTVGSVEANGAGEQLTVSVHGLGAEQLTLPQSWIPGQIPALVAGDLPPGSTQDRFALTGIDGKQQAARRAATIERVPASGPDTSVVNLDLAGRGRELAPTDRIEVWFGSDDALVDDVTTALASRGVEIATVTRLAEVRRQYDESAAAWSLQLAVLVGAAALLISLLVLLVSAASTWRVRTRDLAALRMAGVPGRSITTTAVAAQLPAVVIGVVAGTAAGLYGAHLALPIVPLFAEAPEVPTLDLATAWGPVVLAAVAAFVVLGLGGLLVGRVLARRSDLQRLREGGP
ncbi:FtsX-like permease family protein [Nocardioides sp.]|uniref:FtsX-like permease family protein n=1 Tax=Nocardioides sp. TaxID=35761 RepID=UPI003784CB02